MAECAFCPHSGSLSLEHIIGRWSRPLFPKENILRFTDSQGTVRVRRSAEINWTARVVCAQCNNTWMSRLEEEHAKPVITPLIAGDTALPITPEVARSIALFAFKTAVIVDHSNRHRPPFFAKADRYAFRERQVMPVDVNMWMCGILRHRTRGNVLALYSSGEAQSSYPLRGYICTLALGHVAIQLVKFKQLRNAKIHPLPGFDVRAVIFWPRVKEGLIWPFPDNLVNSSDVRGFAERWKSVSVEFPPPVL